MDLVAKIKAVDTNQMNGNDLIALMNEIRRIKGCYGLRRKC